MAIYRIENEFLLCYDGQCFHVSHREACPDLPLEFAFYVNKAGWRSRTDFMIYWEGVPTGFGE